MEASDELGPRATKLTAYPNTAAGYAMATAHIAALRAGGVRYSICSTGNEEYPFGVFVLPVDTARSVRIIRIVGLGSDMNLSQP
jgi:hypothetical protein